MAYLLKCLIQIGSYQFDQVHEIVIDSDRSELSDVGLLRVPSKIHNAARGLEGEFKAGDPVSIKICYAGYTEQTEFNGYVKKITPSSPMEIDLEDETYILQRRNINKTWEEPVTLPEIVEYIADGYEIIGQVPTVNFKYFKILNENAAQALQKLKDEYRFTCYFRDKKLFVGFVGTDLQGNVNYDLSRNVIETRLEYMTEDQVQYEVDVTGWTDENEEINITVGDPGGAKRTLTFYNIESEACLRSIAEEELKKLKYEGYSGYFLTFGLPYVRHGSVASLTDPEYPARAGRYLVERVRTVFGMEGFKREVYLGRKV